jgi:capsular polysaccharide export protein
MLVFAQEEHPGCPVVIKTHPETAQGYRSGYFTDADTNDRVTFLDAPVSPWALFEGAIFAGHKPRVFGKPFYAGWGLTSDEFPVPRRQRTLTRAQLFAGAMILYPTWYDPYRDRLGSLEDTIEALAAQARAWREDRHGWTAAAMRLWKRAHLQKFYGSVKPVVFADSPSEARTSDRRWMVWASKAALGQEDAVRVEDGFLRSKGLGAELVPPLSLVADDLGIYYDPTRPSRLETLITARAEMRHDQHARARKLIDGLKLAGLSKYNIRDAAPAETLTKGHRILVPGQVEDDASVLRGAGDLRTNLQLLEAARAAHPDAVILYKPHPDVEAGLRDGSIEASSLADHVLDRCDPVALLEHVDAVWTMTSLLGFEALLRGVPVTTLGTPFYAGWGLTKDLGDVPPRRRATVSLEGLVHAALIDYPRYLDPHSGLPCPVEVIVDRLSTNSIPRRGAANRILSKLQGLFASQSHLWRKS